MSKGTLGLFHMPWSGNYDAPQTIVAVYRRSVWYKANPRTEEYMRDVFRRLWPDGEFVNIASDPQWLDRAQRASSVVLVYPDAIGLGFLKIESAIKRTVRRPVTVLSGRQRQFLLDGRTRRQLYLRRFLERTMLLEAVAIILFLVATPFLLGIDLIRRRV
jgi:hypothetical protein